MLDFINVKNFTSHCSVKETFKEWKDQLQIRKAVPTKHISHKKYLQSTYLIKDLCPEYIKNSQKSKETKQTKFLVSKLFNRHLTKEDKQKANRHIYSHSISLDIQKTQN